MRTFVIWCNGEQYFVEAENLYEATKKLRDELNNQ